MDIRATLFRRRLVASVAVCATALAVTVALPSTRASADRTARAGGITYTSNTVRVSTATLKSQLLSVSKDGSTYTFKSRTGSLKKLAKGKVMLLQDLAVRDVTATKMSHGHLVVSSTAAELTDLVRNGTISWKEPINFKNGYGIGGPAVPDPMARSLAAKFGLHSLRAGKGITFKGKVHGYSYTAGFTSVGKDVEVAITITRSTPIELKVTLKGTLQHMQSVGKIAVTKGKVAQAKMLANGMHGDFTLEYSAKPISAFGLGQAGGIKVELPAELAVPFFIGPIPFFLGIKVAFLASAGFSNFDQKLTGKWELKYDGQGGFTASNSGGTSAAGLLKGIEDLILNARNAVRDGPLSFVLGAQMPEVELGLGVKGVNVAGNVTLVGNTGIAVQGGCDTRRMEIIGTAGAEANFFGFSASTTPATLFDKSVEKAYPAGCGTFPR